MKRSLSDITRIVASYKVGMKRVLLATFFVILPDEFAILKNL